MKKNITVFLTLLTIASFQLAKGQVTQFPQVYYNGQGSGGFDLEIHQSDSYSAQDVDELSLTSKIGAELLETNNTDTWINWIKVCLPGTSSTDNSPNYGYMPCDELYARINESNNYATVNTVSTPLGIRTCAGCTTSYVTINSQDAFFGKGSIVALTGGSSGGWYEVYLTKNCSQATGWVNGIYLSFPSGQNNYYNVGGRVCNNNGNCSYLGNINGATITLSSWGTTFSSGGFYQYKVPANWSGTISCTCTGYSSSTPQSYSYIANSNNYTNNFILGNQSSQLEVKIDTIQALNCGDSTHGVLSVTAVGGNEPYTYSWSNGATTQTISGLSPGAYIVIVEDASGYQIGASANLTSPSSLEISSTIIQPSGCNGSSGSITVVNVRGGSGNYSYSWSNGDITPQLTGLSTGVYTLTVSDDLSGCKEVSADTITESSGLSLSLTPSSGAISSNITGGKPPYTFKWSNGATTPDISGLKNGVTYYVTVTDIDGCTAEANAEVGGGAGNIITGNVNDAFVDTSSGQIELNALSSIAVNLYASGTSMIVQSVITNSSGQFSFSNLSGTVYDVEAIYTFGSYSYKTKESGVSINTSNVLLKLPTTLIEQIRNYNNELSNLMCYVDEVGQSFDVPSYFILGSVNYLSSASVILNNQDQVIESLGRLFIAERNLYKYYNQADVMNNEYTDDIIVSLKAIFDFYDIAEYDQSSLFSDIIEQTTDAISSLIIDLCESSFSSLPDNERHNLEISIETENDILQENLLNSGGISPSTFITIFSSPIASTFSNVILGANTSSTQPSLDNSINNSISNTYSGTFTSHFGQVQSLEAASQSQTDYSQAYASSLRADAENNVLSDILDIANAATAGSNPLLDLADIAAHSYKFIVLGFSMNECSNRLFDIANETNQALPNAYRLDGGNANNFNSDKYRTRSATTDSNIVNFELELSNTMSDISFHNSISYKNHLLALSTLNQKLNSSLHEDILTLKAAMPYSGIYKVDSVFLSNLPNTLLISSGYRSAFIFDLIALIDTTSNTIVVDSLTSYYSNIIASDANIHDELQNFGSLVSNSSTPPLLAIYELGVPIIMSPDTTIAVKINFKNYGATTGTSIYMKFNTDGVFNITPDSVFFGNLSPSQADSAIIQLTSPKKIDTIGKYSITLGGSNINYLAKGGAIITKNNVAGLTRYFTNTSLDFTCSPNPNNGSFEIDFNHTLVNSELTIFNSMGQTVYDNHFSTETKQLNISLGDLSEGIYFIQIVSNQGVQTKKFVIVK